MSTATAVAGDVLIDKQSVWRYFADSQYPAQDWHLTAFNDSSWSAGPGILGYGESFITTVVPYGPDPNNKYITTCFRHSFELVVDPATFTQLILAANHDDGFAAYLNGVEVARRSLPDGTISYGTLASSHEGGTYEAIDISAHVDLLTLGTNVLAVEVHQRSGSSSDLVWDAELSTSSNLVQFMWSGAVTTESVRVNAKVIPDSAVARLAVSIAADLSNPQYSSPDTALGVVNNRVVSLAIGNLDPDVQYYYGLEVNGVLNTDLVGKFKTLPSGRSSFTFAFASCAWTGSTHAVFDTIRALEPLFFVHMGDLHYENIGVNDRDVFRNAFETVLGSASQSHLYRDVPIVYMWDDHDYGPNNSDSTAPGREAARLTYQEYVPHYPLVAGSGNVPIYYAFSVGRVRFIVCDSRSARSPYLNPDNPDKTMLGTTQKAWFKQELLNGRDNHALTVWVNTLPWIGVTGDDGWYVYTFERTELADFIADSNITNLCMISGDAHMIAIDDGTNSDYATGGGAGFPVMHAAPLDRSPSAKGGPYSHGIYLAAAGQFGLMSVTDAGDSIQVDWSGRRLGEEVVNYSFSYFAGDCCENRGNADNDCTLGCVTVADLSYLVDYLFNDGPPPGCSEEGNTDADCTFGCITVADLSYLVSYLFQTGPAPPPCP